VSGDNTWAEKSYAVSVFWSDDPLSVFQKMPDDQLVIQPNDVWDSPGHNCIIQDALGQEWVCYHAVDTTDRYIAGTDRFFRKMCMERVFYTADGWPYVKGGSPSYQEQEGPVIRQLPTVQLR
jgi:arabinan endo-1,5-alpha-L-arabinosidase